MTTKKRTMVDVLTDDALRYGSERKFIYKKKVTGENLKSEIAIARILGEMSATERIISELVLNPEWERSDLEAALHVFVVECGDAAHGLMGTKNNIDIDAILECHGYHAKFYAEKAEKEAKAREIANEEARS